MLSPSRDINKGKHCCAYWEGEGAYLLCEPEYTGGGGRVPLCDPGSGLLNGTELEKG